MLTINPPIELTCKQNMLQMHSDFDEKLRGNYTQMDSSLRREELLYLTTQPPEVYLAEGDVTNILNEVVNSGKQENRLEIINNLINRILVSGTANVTYQDKVYISNTLRKLGITDVNTFMKEVYKTQEETRNNNRLIKLYADNYEQLTQILKEESQKGGKDAPRKEADAPAENRYYLHEEIYNRLMTGRIYEQISTFNESLNSAENIVNRNELLTARQMNLSNVFALQELRNEIYEKASPLTYLQSNIYEEAGEEEIPSAKSDDLVSAATLLNIVNQTYQLRGDSIERNSHNWINIAGALFESAESVTNRYESTHRSGDYNPTYTEPTRERELVERILKEEASPQSEEEAISVREETLRLTRELNQINEENTRKYRLLQETLPARETPKDRKVLKDKTGKDLLRALEHPEEVLREASVREQSVTNNVQVDARIQALYNLMEEDTKLILEQAAKYQGQTTNPLLEHPEYLAELSGKSTEEVALELMQHPIEEALPAITDVVKTEAEHIREEKKRERHRVTSLQEKHYTDEQRRLSFVHRSQESLDTEEILNQLQQQKEIQNVHETTNIVNHEEHKNVVTNTQTVTHNQVQDQRRVVEELVSRNVEGSLGRISDAVYNRIEKRLSTEKKRRGF